MRSNIEKTGLKGSVFSIEPCGITKFLCSNSGNFDFIPFIEGVIMYLMKKVFIMHGFEGSPNGGWRPWLMGELEKQDIYACALPMPDPANPVCDEWIEEISGVINDSNREDEIYLVGHSLGSTAILRYLESAYSNILTSGVSGVVLTSCPIEKNKNSKISSFLETPFDFEKIKTKAKKFAIIHGDNDPNVPLRNAEVLAKELNGDLVVIKDGGHLNGSSGFRILPECLDALMRMGQY